jgi:transcriptional regulator with XRE-family HTH domain
MGRHAHPALAGMDRLGQRLRELRSEAGISQTELARRLGFDPTHGYKYVLRLERGLVPNPTLRTLTGFLAACGVSWDRIVEVLPQTTAPASSGEPQPDKPPVSESQRPALESAVVQDATLVSRRRDRRPLRERLRAERIAERQQRDRAYWSTVARVEARVRSLLRAARVRFRSEAAYLAFARTCCGLLGNEAVKPDMTERELTRQAQAAVQSGLERSLVQQIHSVCLDAFRPSGATG